MVMIRIEVLGTPSAKVDLNDSGCDLTGFLVLLCPAVNQVPVIRLSGQDVYEMLETKHIDREAKLSLRSLSLSAEGNELSLSAETEPLLL